MYAAMYVLSSMIKFDFRHCICVGERRHVCYCFRHPIDSGVGLHFAKPDARRDFCAASNVILQRCGVTAWVLWSVAETAGLLHDTLILAT